MADSDQNVSELVESASVEHLESEPQSCSNTTDEPSLEDVQPSTVLDDTHDQSEPVDVEQPLVERVVNEALPVDQDEEADTQFLHEKGESTDQTAEQQLIPEYSEHQISTESMEAETSEESKDIKQNPEEYERETENQTHIIQEAEEHINHDEELLQQKQVEEEQKEQEQEEKEHVEQEENEEHKEVEQLQEIQAQVEEKQENSEQAQLEEMQKLEEEEHQEKNETEQQEEEEQARVEKQSEEQVPSDQDQEQHLQDNQAHLELYDEQQSHSEQNQEDDTKEQVHLEVEHVPTEQEQLQEQVEQGEQEQKEKSYDKEEEDEQEHENHTHLEQEREQHLHIEHENDEQVYISQEEQLKQVESVEYNVEEKPHVEMPQEVEPHVEQEELDQELEDQEKIKQENKNDEQEEAEVCNLNEQPAVTDDEEIRNSSIVDADKEDQPLEFKENYVDDAQDHKDTDVFSKADQESPSDSREIYRQSDNENVDNQTAYEEAVEKEDTLQPNEEVIVTTEELKMDENQEPTAAVDEGEYSTGFENKQEVEVNSMEDVVVESMETQHLGHEAETLDEHSKIMEDNMETEMATNFDPTRQTLNVEASHSTISDETDNVNLKNDISEDNIEKQSEIIDKEQNGDEEIEDVLPSPSTKETEKMMDVSETNNLLNVVHEAHITEQDVAEPNTCFALQQVESAALESLEEIDDIKTNQALSSSEHVTTAEQKQTEIYEPINTEARDQQVCFAQLVETEPEQQNIEPLEDVSVEQVEPSNWVIDETTPGADVHKFMEEFLIETEEQPVVSDQIFNIQPEVLVQNLRSDNEQERAEKPFVEMTNHVELYGPEDHTFATITHEEVVEISPTSSMKTENVQQQMVKQNNVHDTVRKEHELEAPIYAVNGDSHRAYLANDFSVDSEEPLSSDKENDQVQFEERYAKLMAKYLPRDNIFDVNNRKQRSKTLEPNFNLNELKNWTDQPVTSRQKSATLGRSGSRKRTRPLPKPAVNDDHLFPDSVTPSKVDRNLSVRSLGSGLPEGTYDVPYIDDDAFVPRKMRNKSAAKGENGNGSDLSTESDEYLWDPSLIRYSALDPAHRADIDECIATPQIAKKTGAAAPKSGRNGGERSFIKDNKSKPSKKRRFFNLCGCVGRRSRK